jgi:hypothetical protein
MGLASKLKFDKPMTVDELQEEVDVLNQDYDLKGPGAVEAAKKALVDAQAHHATGTITWRDSVSDRLVHMERALGKPPAAIAGRVGEYEFVKFPEHQKACGCAAWELRPTFGYVQGRQVLKFEEQRVCINPKGYAASKPKPAKTAKTAKAKKKVKPLTDAQLAAQAKREQAAEEKREREQRARDEKEISQELAVRKAEKPAATGAYTKLRKASIPIDVARAIVYDEVLSPDGMEMLGREANGPAWARILKMPAKKISELAGSFIAKRLERAFVPGYASVDLEEGDRAAAAYFGIKVAAPKAAKKKARR